jgi:NAD(P)-dependent dehydrogenase (short-subunit alcohol dehydrogenase family)
MAIRGKVTLVAGGNRGIGRAIAMALTKVGAKQHHAPEREA